VELRNAGLSCPAAFSHADWSHSLAIAPYSIARNNCFGVRRESDGGRAEV
jgi:hypothetical protein